MDSILECWTETLYKKDIPLILRIGGFLFEDKTPQTSSKKHRIYSICPAFAEKPLNELFEEWFYAKNLNGEDPYKTLESLRTSPEVRSKSKPVLIYSLKENLKY